MGVSSHIKFLVITLLIRLSFCITKMSIKESSRKSNAAYSLSRKCKDGHRAAHLALLAFCLLLGAVNASGEVKPSDIGCTVYFKEEVTRNRYTPSSYTIREGAQGVVVPYESGSRFSNKERTITVRAIAIGSSKIHFLNVTPADITKKSPIPEYQCRQCAGKWSKPKQICGTPECKGTKTEHNTCSGCNEPWQGRLCTHDHPRKKEPERKKKESARGLNGHHWVPYRHDRLPDLRIANNPSKEGNERQTGAARAFFTRQLTLQTKDIEFENGQDAFVEETVNQIMPVFRRKSDQMTPVKFWKESQKWVAREIATKKATPETGGTGCLTALMEEIAQAKRDYAATKMRNA